MVAVATVTHMVLSSAPVTIVSASMKSHDRTAPWCCLGSNVASLIAESRKFGRTESGEVEEHFWPIVKR